MRRDDDEPGAECHGGAVRHAGLDARPLGKFGFCEDDPVAIFTGAADGDGEPAIFRVQDRLDRCVKAVQIRVEDDTVAGRLHTPYSLTENQQPESGS